MSDSEREIPEGELRNDLASVLRRVALGERLRITVRGQPVAGLVPLSDARHFVPRSEFGPILLEHPLDSGFARDIRGVLRGTVDEL